MILMSEFATLSRLSLTKIIQLRIQWINESLNDQYLTNNWPINYQKMDQRDSETFFISIRISVFEILEFFIQSDELNIHKDWSEHVRGLECSVMFGLHDYWLRNSFLFPQPTDNFLTTRCLL